MKQPKKEPKNWIRRLTTFRNGKYTWLYLLENGRGCVIVPGENGEEIINFFRQYDDDREGESAVSYCLRKDLI